MSRLISTQAALALATSGLVLAAGPAIAQTVGRAAAVNPAATTGREAPRKRYRRSSGQSC